MSVGLLVGLVAPVQAQTFTLTIQPNTLPPATNGVAYSRAVTAVGGNADYTLSVTSGSLPPGLTLNGSNGTYTLSGTAGTAGSYSFTITATDIDGNTGFRPYTFSTGTVGGLSISPSSLPNGTQNSAYSQTLTGSGGTGPYTFTRTSGTLPAGMSLSSGGVLNGTPTNGGAFSFTVGVTDTAGNSGSRSYTLNIGTNSVTVSPTTLPNGTQGAAYAQSVSASGGTGPYTFAVTSGAVPAGTTLDAAGNITGTPTTVGAYSFTVRAVDSLNNFGTRSYTVNIGSNSLTVSPTTLPGGTVGTGYNQTVTASGGTAPYTFAVSSGALPNGLALAAGGGLTGTPTAAGTFNFDVQATDAANNTGVRSYSVVIAMAPLTINPTTLPNGTIGTAYNRTVTATGGVAPYSYVISAGALPTGLTMSTGGAITGTPTTAGAYTFTVEATDAQPNTGTRTYTVNIGANNLVVAPTTLPAGTRGVAYSQTVTASGGTGPYTYTLLSGTLPAGLSLSSGGAITGTPTTGGVSTFTVRAQDTLGNAGTRLYNVSIGTSSLTVNPATLPGTVRGKAYRQTVTATGGTAPYTFSVNSGTLPPGLTLNSATGVISGTPATTGIATFTVGARDINGNIGARAYALQSRADAASDPEVQGLILSQVATAQRFASAQVSNVTRHLESLHDRFDPCSFNFGMAPSLQQAPPSYGALGYAGPSQTYSPNDAYGALARYQPQQQSYAPQQVYAPPSGPAGRGMPYQQACAADWASSMSAWTAGTFEFGSVTPSGAANSRFNTAGLTAGVDWKLNRKLIVGASVGYGSDRSEIGGNGTRSDAISYSGTLYASFKPTDLLFVDAAVGYGTLGFKNRRFVTGDGSVASSERKGGYWFGAVTASLELGRDGVKAAPYVSADMMSASFERSSEQGSAMALTYDSMDAKSLSGAIGLRGSIDIPTDNGVLTPNARIEYRQTRQSAFDQLLYYSDLGTGSASTFSQAEGTTGATTAALGLRAKMAGGMTAEVEYSFTKGAGDYISQAIKAALRLPF